MNAGSAPARRTPSGRPPPPPRVLRSNAMALGMALVAALDESPVRTATPSAAAMAPAMATPPLSFQRPRSDSTLSSDTFDGIYALGDDDVGAVDVDDVDMDDLQCADAFRPSAMLLLVDRKLEDEFGRASDLERLLFARSSLGGRSSGSNDDGSASELPSHALAPDTDGDATGMDVDVDVDEDEAAAVMAHLAQLDAQQHAVTFMTAADRTTMATRSGFCAVLPAAGTRRVVVQGGNASAADATDATMATAQLPLPGNDTKRRVHKRTFGERAATFRVGSLTTSPVKASATALRGSTIFTTTIPTKATTTTTTARRPRSLFREAAEDIAGRRDVDWGRREPSPPRDGQDHEMDETMSAATGSATVEIKIEPGAEAAQTSVPHNVATSSHGSAFHTPQRRTGTTSASAMGEFVAPSAFFTPVAMAPTAASASTTIASTSISPAPTFDKVAVVHAKDTPGKVDKFEWTIRRGSRVPVPPTPTPPDASLPPPYLRDATSSALPKRRVHSSTFGSFARSFSFATP